MMSIWHWAILLLVFARVFGTGKVNNLGKDFCSAISGFKAGLTEDSHQNSDLTVSKHEGQKE